MDFESCRYLKIIVDGPVFACEKTINVTDSLITDNVTSTLPIHFDDKKVRYKMGCYILHIILLLIKLLFAIIIICYNYLKHN